jgi:putative membrane protein
MYTARYFPLAAGLMWTRRIFLGAGLWSGGLVLAHMYLDVPWLQIPALPVAIMGTAVAFYLGFKGNAAYGRTWEGRMIWGGIVNSSRTWGIYTRDVVTGEGAEAVHQELIYRHVAWLGALRTQLLRAKPWEHREPWNDTYRENFNTLDQSPEVMAARIKPFVSDEEQVWLMERKNQATQLLANQSRRLAELRKEGKIDAYPYVELMRLLETFYTLQGKCERIKNFPLPRQYASANHWFVMAFIGLIPLALVPAFAALGPDMLWLVVPISTGISWVFFTWDMVVDYSENPFEGLINDIPMASLSRTIEIDLREILGEQDVPGPLPAPAENVVM